MSADALKLIASSPSIAPPPAYTAKSYVASLEDYLEMYRRSIEDPASFWSDLAGS